MTSKKHLEEIEAYVKEFGKTAACEKFNLKPESLKRLLRFNKTTKGKPVDIEKNTLLSRIAEKYSDGELKALLDDTFKPTHGQTTYSFDGETIKFAVMTDLHIGSKFTNENRISAALEECKAQDVKLILVSGDITEGMSGRDGHVYELTHMGYSAQKKAAIELFSTCDIDIKMISGNHDLWYVSKNNTGALIVKDICGSLPNAEYLGEHEAIVYINGVKVMMWHGEDGSSYALSYRTQKIIESLSGGEKPQILITGHDHKQGYFFTRNVHSLMGGCIQSQTPFMRYKKLAAHEGFWIIEATIKDAEIKKFKPEWIPFYK